MTHRTALITAGSIAAVVFAGAIAMGVNLGILSVADSSPVGKLSAAAPVQPAAAKEIQVYTGAASSQKYIIRKAGSLEIAAGKGGVRLMSVNARRHWKWSLTQTANKRLTVTFTSHGKVYLFLAKLGRHGAILARVDQPITRIVTRAAPAAPVSYAAVPVSRPAAPVSVAAAAPGSSAKPAPAQGGDDNSGGGQDD
jgi:hypothetical protein